MQKRKPSNYKWSKEKCQEEALKYNYKIDFKNNAGSAYRSSLLNKWSDEICSHMKPKCNSYKRIVYRYIFSDGFCYIGLTYNPEKRNYQHHNAIDSSVYKHIILLNEEPTYELLTDYTSVEEAKEQEKQWIILSKKEGFKILNKAKAGACGSNNLIWTKEKCIIESKKYNTISELIKNNTSVYNNVKRFNIENICFNHMTSSEKPNGYWTFERCKEEALKYKTRYEYFLNASGSHESARRNKWLDIVCSHMLKRVEKWTDEKCKIEFLKYINMTELRKNNNTVYKKILKKELLKIWQII